MVELIQNRNRLMLIVGDILAVFMANLLAVGIADKIPGNDPERALPAVINELVPVGIKGLLIAALIAALMSTVDGFVNSSAAYFVKDIYQQHLAPHASQKHLVKVSYITTAAIMILGIILGWNSDTIDKIWGWIIMSRSIWAILRSARFLSSRRRF